MVQQQRTHRTTQARHVLGAWLAVGGEFQQRAAGRGFAAADIAEQTARAVFGVEDVARGRVDVSAVAFCVPGEAHAQRLDQVALEPAECPCQRQVDQRQPGAGLAVDRVQQSGAIVTRRQPQHQFVEIEAGKHRLALQTRRFVNGLGALQPVSYTHLDVYKRQAALRALNGHREHVLAMRGLFLQELPASATRTIDAAHRNDEAMVRAEVHRLQASCGFVGAARIASAVDGLRAHLSLIHI